ncbi:hypothetical protein [Saccharothrix obliqua]|uniref:hypothetical protein n=1 Tax=Saccharothrix obliqua TaxID=2861747 RepID=UPI001C5D2F06|nr:hypothetical protein [Saccharothrix obliqua]MBW4718009.1 hypothetical protein [Saccharothrix obliqua]
MPRYLVLHDYGMGGLWWWIHADSARQVLETFAEVEVIDRPEELSLDLTGVAEVDVDAPVLPAGLDGLRDQRTAQRDHPDFGALADLPVVHLRYREEDGAHLYEVGPDGRRLRQVEITPAGVAYRGTPDDWLFNPPVADLFDPELVGHRITEAEFEAAWHAARPDDRA